MADDQRDKSLIEKAVSAVVTPVVEVLDVDGISRRINLGPYNAFVLDFSSLVCCIPNSDLLSSSLDDISHRLDVEEMSRRIDVDHIVRQVE